MAKKIAKKNKSTPTRSSAAVSTVPEPIRQKRLKNPVQNYGHREIFVRPEYNLAELSSFMDGESYVSQAIQKKSALMFKEGFSLSGENERILSYLKTRIKQIEFVTKVPWKTLLKETGRELLLKSNFFWVKVRNKDASGGRSINGTTPPVAGYFGMPAETVKVKKNRFGKIIKYKQEVPGFESKEFDPEDIVHWHYNRKAGIVFATPTLVPVLGDIRALRRLEENVEVLIYQTLFPIFHYKVGTESKPAGDVRLEDGTVMSEVDYVRNQVSNMPTEGGIVTPERHNIEYIGAKSQIPNYKELLDYFKRRVIAGLGISSLDLGDGDSSTRSTADSLSKALVDSVKDFQGAVEDVMNSEVIAELLLEAPFARSIDVLSPDNCPEWKFHEIDIEEQMKKNVNAQLMYNSDIWDINETRKQTGKEPIGAWQESLLYTERTTLKELKAQTESSIELASVTQKMAATQSPGTSSSSKRNAAKKTAVNKSRPTNQHGTKTGPQKSIKDRWLRNEERVLEQLSRISDKETIEQYISGARKRLEKKMNLLPKEERQDFADQLKEIFTFDF